MASARRNGLLSSCEPCRKSKLRCDHTTPVCGRCTHRNQPDLCIYHPAPLTQDPGPRQQRRKRQRNNNDRAEHPLGQLLLFAGSTESLEDGSLPRTVAWNKKPPLSTPTGFLGPTSYSAVFAEHDDCLTPSAANSSTTITPKQLQVGAQVLLLLSQEIPFYEKVFEARFKVFRGWTLGRPIVWAMFQTVKKTIGFWFANGKDDNTALLLARELFENSARPVEVRSDVAFPEYIASISVRWETIGLLFSIAGLASSLIPYDDPVSKGADPKSLANHATAVGDICLRFCDHLGNVNDPLIWLLLHHTAALTLVYGDSDYRPWKKLGELSTAVFALGLHQEADHTVPFFLRETRKRIMIGAFTIDKQLATFLGRPPLVSWRYCDIPFPLDLSYDEIVAEPDVRDAAIAKLNENDGWNTEGSPSKGGLAQAILMASIIREKVLELSLCRHPDDLRQKAENLSQESRQMRRDLPGFLRWTPDTDAPCAHDDNALFSLHLEFLHSDFLLYRVLDRHTHGPFDGIINVSQEILNSLHIIIAKKNRSRKPLLDIGWILCYICLPAASVLAIGLLRRSPARSQSPSATAPFPCSEIIQNLSIFASYLESMVDPAEGNYEVSQQGRKALRHVLDRVLSEPPVQSLCGREDASGDVSFGADVLGDAALDDGMQFLEWLDGNIDYRRDPWLNWLIYS